MLIAVATLVGGCRKAHFKLELTLNPEIWGNYRLEYYAHGKEGGGKWITQTLPLDQGKFSMQGVSLEPTVGRILIPGSDGIGIWIEPGNEITISGKESDPAKWDVGGNEINREWTAFRLRNSVNPDSLQSRIAGYIKKNPESRLSSLLLLTEFDRRGHEEEFADLWNTLDKKAKAEETARLCGDADLMSEYPFTLTRNGKLRYDAPRREIRSLLIKGKNNRSRILKFRPGEPTLLWFYRRSDSFRADIVDTLKRLLKERTDSTESRITTISMDADPIVWNASTSADSLKGAIEGWMPLATADRRARMLGVTSSPYFIVIDPKGRQTYRGESVSEAARAFRKLKRDKKDKNKK